MTLRAAFLLTLAATALALDNRIVFRDLEGAGQTGLPVSVFVTGAPGDFTGYPRPAAATYNSSGELVSSRALLPAWQSDAKTRHRNATAVYSLASVAARSHTTCSTTAHCEPSMYGRVTVSGTHGVFDGETVTISGASPPELNGTWRAVDRTDTSIELAGLNTVGSPGAASGSLAAPDYGDWATGVVTFYLDLPPGGHAEVDFVDSPNPSHAGDAAATAASALTRAQLSARSWTAATELCAPVASGNTSCHTIDARAILDDTTNAPTADCGVKRWLGGPLVTEWIIESRCAEPGFYDRGWEPIQLTNTIADSGLANTTQSDGSQTFTVSAAMTGLEASPGAPLLAQVGAGGVKVRQFVSICDITGTTLTVCSGGRGFFGTSIYSVAAGTKIFFLQYKDPAAAWRHVSPSFHIRAYTRPDGNDFGAERIRFVVNNTSAGAGVTGYFSMRFATSSGTRFQSPFVWFNQGSRASKIYWDGTSAEHYCAGGSGQDPCASGVRSLRVRLETNIPWMVHSQVIPAYRSDAVADSLLTAHQDLYDASDKGEIGTPLSAYKYWSGACVAFDSSVPVLGGATYAQGKYFIPSCASMSTDDDTRAEPWFFFRNVADMLIATGQPDSRPWEHLFGSSVSGGAGTIEAENHINLVYWHGSSAAIDAGQFTTAACAGCTGYGRVLSLDRRYNVYIGDSNGWMLSGGNQITRVSGPDADSPWHATRPRIMVIAATTLDQAHRAPVAAVAYLLTGDYYHLEGIQSWSAWNLLYRNFAAAGNLGGVITTATVRRLNWGIGEAGRDLLRQTSWPALALFYANLLQPNVAQFGNSYVPPESHYFRRAMVRQIRAQEGFYHLSGAAAVFQPRNADCTDITYADSGALIPANTSDIYCYGYQYSATARELPVMMNRGGAAGTCSGCDAGKSARFESAYNHFGMLGVYGFIAQHPEYNFARGVRDRIARTVITGVRNIDFSPYLLARFHLPVIPTTSGYSFTGRLGTVTVPANETAQTWEVVRDALSVESLSTWPASSVQPHEDVAYPSYLRAALATVYGSRIADLTSHGCAERTGGCSAEGAYTLVAALAPVLDTTGRRVTIRPLDDIQALALSATSSSVSISMRNPARPVTGAAARVAVATARPAAADDSADAVMTCRGDECSMTVSGLSAGTSYWVRVSAGTARAWRQVLTTP